MGVSNVYKIFQNLSRRDVLCSTILSNVIHIDFLKVQKNFISLININSLIDLKQEELTRNLGHTNSSPKEKNSISSPLTHGSRTLIRGNVNSGKLREVT